MHRWNPDQIPILQLGPDFYDEVRPARFPEQRLRYWNTALEGSGLNRPLAPHFADFTPLSGNLPAPLALRYHGHQFQHYNPDLGDGRGFLFAQLLRGGQWYDLGTKGSGQTPYSRGGDGRLTLKGALREALATEMLESLGVKTSRTLCFFETGEDLIRHDEPSPTRSAVLTRFSLGHIRIGTFQRLAFRGETENIRRLTSYCMAFYYGTENAALDRANEDLVAETFLRLVTGAVAKLAAQVMMAGFVHGVLNTDNVNISGELFDYGPYRFMPEYDPGFTAAYFDQQGLYAYGRQPVSFLWALHQLAGSLKTAYPHLPAETVLAEFSGHFQRETQTHFLHRLNLQPRSEAENQALLGEFFQLLETRRLKFEKIFFDFHSQKVLNQPALRARYEKDAPELLKRLEAFTVADAEQARHPYFQRAEPVTLLIDEIESIWAPIASHDDWGLFENKLTDLRSFRGLY